MRHAIHQYVKTNNKYMKDCDKYKDLSYLKYWHIDNLHQWAMSQNSPLDVFKWLEKDLNSMKISIKTIKKHGGRAYFLEIDFENLVNLHKFHNDLPFFPQRMKT